MPYRHTQRGVWIVLPCLVFAAVDAVIAWRSGQWLPVAVLIVRIAVATMFSSLRHQDVASGPIARLVRPG
jgi:predicted permease